MRKCYVRETGTLRAVKIISKAALEKSAAGEDEKKRMLQETEILRQLDHPNIIKLYEFYQDKKHYYLVTE